MFGPLLLLFICLPILEFTLLMEIHAATSLLTTIIIVMVTGFIGASLARWQGWQTMARIRTDMAAGKMPGDALLDGVMILLAGAVLITPGVLTDLFGFLLLVPQFRSLIKKYLAYRLKNNLHVHTSGSQNGFHFGTTFSTGNPAADDPARFPTSPNENGQSEVLEAKVIHTHIEDADE